MSAIHWSIVLAKIDLVSLYFRLLWYHSILKGSIDQYSKIYSTLACSRWLPRFPDLSRPYFACVKRGSGKTYVRSQSLSSAESAVKSISTSVPCRAKKDSNIPSPGRIRLVKCPTPGREGVITTRSNRMKFRLWWRLFISSARIVFFSFTDFENTRWHPNSQTSKQT